MKITKSFLTGIGFTFNKADNQYEHNCGVIVAIENKKYIIKNKTRHVGGGHTWQCYALSANPDCWCVVNAMYNQGKHNGEFDTRWEIMMTFKNLLTCQNTNLRS